MLVSRKEIINESNADDNLIEGYYDSANVMKTIFIPKRQYLYIIFKNGLVYSYQNISPELYEKLEKADSQGKFFIAEIKKKPTIYNYVREYKLYEFERMDIISLIDEEKKKAENQTNS